MTSHALHYLDFELSDNTEGLVTFDAMASATPRHLSALHAEITRVLDWAYATFPDGPAPTDEGAPWDYDLQGTQERSVPDALHYDARTRCLSSTPGGAETLRHTVTLSISGTETFGEAFRAAFGVGE